MTVALAIPTVETASYLCSCGGTLQLHHMDDLKLEWFKCSKCGDQKNKSQLELLPRKEFIASLEATDEELSQEFTLEELNRILSLMIKGDDSIKEILFLVSLLTFTDSEQTGAIITGETSLGKTYNIREVLWFFSTLDVNGKQVVDWQAGASAKSFIHRRNAEFVDVDTLQPIDYSLAPKKGDPAEMFTAWNKVLKSAGYLLDYSQKIFVLPDMDNTDLLKVLRPILSHDKKISKFSITEKVPNGFRTKDVLIKGFFTIFFATATTYIDEQEASRHFLLSPKDDQEKMKQSIDLIARKSYDTNFADWYENDPDRVKLKKRVAAIQAFKCSEIVISQELTESLKEWFLSKTSFINPKLQRDFPRLLSLVKAWTLFNWKNRQTGKRYVLQSTQADVDVAKVLYGDILSCNELGITPEEYEIWTMVKDVCDDGLSVSAIHDLFYKHKKRNISDKRLRGILKNFCRAGLLREEKNGTTWIYYPADVESQPKEGWID